MENNIHLIAFPDDDRSIIFKNGVQIFAFDNQIYELLETLHHHEVNFKEIESFRFNQFESKELLFRTAIDMTYPEILEHIREQENA